MRLAVELLARDELQRRRRLQRQQLCKALSENELQRKVNYQGPAICANNLVREPTCLLVNVGHLRLCISEGEHHHQLEAGFSLGDI